MIQGNISFSEVRSQSLVGNPLSDPHHREVMVYTPPSYNKDVERHYPLLMVLAPYAGTHWGLLQDKMWEKNFLVMLEEAFATGTQEAVVICPDASNRWGGSQFLNSAATGRYQDFLVDDVLSAVESKYRILPGARGVVGRSSGGFGALRLMTDRPGVFDAVGAHAPDAMFEVSLRPRFTAAMIKLRQESLSDFMARTKGTGPTQASDFEFMMLIAETAAYAPEHRAPDVSSQLPFTTLPVSADGHLNEEVFKNMCKQDPLQILKQTQLTPKPKLVFLDAGNADEHGLQIGAERLAEALRAQGVTVVHEEFKGTHRGTAHRYARSIPLLLQALMD